jgi:hypothetical protein
LLKDTSAVLHIPLFVCSKAAALAATLTVGVRRTSAAQRHGGAVAGALAGCRSTVGFVVAVAIASAVARTIVGGRGSGRRARRSLASVGGGLADGVDELLRGR